MDAHVDVDAARARGLRPAHEAEVGEGLAHDPGDGHELRPLDARHGVEVDAQLVGMVEVLGAHRMRVELQAAEVRHPGQGGRVARDDLLGGAAGGEAAARRPRSTSGRAAGARFW